MVTFTHVIKFGDNVGKSFKAVCMSKEVDVDVDKITFCFLFQINNIKKTKFRTLISNIKLCILTRSNSVK